LRIQEFRIGAAWNGTFNGFAHKGGEEFPGMEKASTLESNEGFQISAKKGAKDAAEE
jgi:hypothetical protein